jgi:hypothetical protein
VIVTSGDSRDKLWRRVDSLQLKKGEPGLSWTAAASTSASLDALRASMVANALTVYPRGTFLNYFNDNFGYGSLPTSGTPTIPDAWITTSIV